MAKTSAQKASRNRATQGKEHPPATAAPASVALVSASTTTLVRDTCTASQHAAPALNEGISHMCPRGNDVVTTYPTPEDQDAEMIILRAQLVAMKLELKRVQEKAARAASTEDTAVVGRYATAAGLNYTKIWSRQDVHKIARVARLARRNLPMLKRFAGDWPIKEYLKTHFNNQRQYWCKVARARAKAAAEGKDKVEGIVDLDAEHNLDMSSDEA
ncbi:hypothetical protein BGY98DRAFT_1054768 [Russula aff. rugulosa BPL654]|nr:hypothetical protein BGY98DRAFT_1054768 [Russula aff. rugulosa BPL654]